jgi:hypothetical protein
MTSPRADKDLLIDCASLSLIMAAENENCATTMKATPPVAVTRTRKVVVGGGGSLRTYRSALAPVFPTRSLPARSTSDNLPCMVWNRHRHHVKHTVKAQYTGTWHCYLHIGRRDHGLQKRDHVTTHLLCLPIKSVDNDAKHKVRPGTAGVHVCGANMPCICAVEGACERCASAQARLHVN